MMRREVQFEIRLATSADIPALRELIDVSVRVLQREDYSAEQLEAALGTAYGVDTQLIADRTYYVVEAAGRAGEPVMAACGGWSMRRTLYGSDHGPYRDNATLDPARDAAKIRAFFVHPEWARRGVGGMILEACEEAVLAAGFRRLEMGATLTGVPFYLAKGYAVLEKSEVPMGAGLTLPIVRMGKEIRRL